MFETAKNTEKPRLTVVFIDVSQLEIKNLVSVVISFHGKTVVGKGRWFYDAEEFIQKRKAWQTALLKEKRPTKIFRQKKVNIS